MHGMIVKDLAALVYAVAIEVVRDLSHTSHTCKARRQRLLNKSCWFSQRGGARTATNLSMQDGTRLVPSHMDLEGGMLAFLVCERMNILG
jgi:hypothetical protein